MNSRTLQQFHFTAYSIMNMITAFCILLQLHGILLISLMNQKTEQQKILNAILCDKRRTIRKIKIAKRKTLNKKKLDGIKWSHRRLVGIFCIGSKSFGTKISDWRKLHFLTLYHTSDPLYHQTLIRPTEEITFIPIYEIKNTKSNLRNALKHRAECKNRRCLSNYSTNSQFSTSTIHLIKENLSMFISLSYQLFETLSLFQHLAN